MVQQPQKLQLKCIINLIQFKLKVLSKLKALFLVGISILFISKGSSQTLDTTALMDKVYKAFELENSNPEGALLLAKEVLRTSEQFNYEKGIAYGCLRIGSIWNSKGKNGNALNYIQRAYEIRKKLNDYEGAASACNELVYIYTETGKLELAFNFALESVRFSELSGDTISLVNSLNELGVLYSRYRNDASNEYFEKALQLAKLIHYDIGIAHAEGNFGMYYFSNKNYNQAIDHFGFAIKLFQYLGDELNTANLLSNYASAKAELGDYFSSSNYYSKALKIYNQIDLETGQPLLYYNLANVYNKRNMPDSAIYYAKFALNDAEKRGDLNIQLELKRALAIAYSDKADFKNAYLNQVEYSKISDSLLNSEKVSSISEMQTKYETEKKEQQIEVLNEKNKTKEAERKVFLRTATIIGLLLIAALVFFIQRSRMAKKNALIAEQRIEAILDEQEINTYNAMLEGQEEERMRIATDLHDRLGSMLSTVKLLFSALDEKIDLNQLENKQQYEKANYLIDEACVEVRRISHNLGTGMVANFGLNRALEELCESIDQTRKIHCQLQIFGITELNLPINIEVGIYRMVQEIVNNSLKHSQAKNLNIQLNQEEDLVRVMVEDDGIGFNIDESGEKGGMGLSNLEQRATKLNGTLHIDSQKGKGVTTIIEIPLNLDA